VTLVYGEINAHRRTEGDVRQLKELFKLPRQWNYDSVRLNKRMKAVTTNRENKPTDSRLWYLRWNGQVKRRVISFYSSYIIRRGCFLISWLLTKTLWTQWWSQCSTLLGRYLPSMVRTPGAPKQLNSSSWNLAWLITSSTRPHMMPSLLQAAFGV